ncbi:hypothetical protein B9G98_02580 [Wickerhamiella sorbophila]|uniref:Uncharacterized protein n=1 Tax=Wickerhamiella sorbophila TaxID=45607 RepID=A0A2T0FIZ7_9ASCO|nr:hypothetical protein B9G98_02580 [Wickerhamiella sorbophila]PRT54960.1 hypothetical protein B9G98_02580 [Wickerhamiella sorbophila]
MHISLSLLHLEFVSRVMQHELLIVLAGYPSSLNGALLLHPSEKDLFEQAIEFGSRVQTIKSACREAATPLARVVEKRVLRPYLECLAAIEKQILSGKGKYGAYPGISVAAIFADSLYKWDRQMEYAQALVQYNGSTAEIIAQTQADCLSGFPEIRDIAQDLSIELDRSWLRSVSSWILWGQAIDWPSIKAHPSLDRETLKCIIDTGNCLQRMNMMQFSLQSKNRDVLKSNARIFESIKVTIDLTDIKDKLTRIRNALLDTVMASPNNNIQLQNTLDLLRKIVLAGSSAFTRTFLETAKIKRARLPADPSNQLFQNAVASYFEDYHELAPECEDLCHRLIKFEVLPEEEQAEYNDQVDDIMFGVRVTFLFELDWPFSLYFTEQQCRVYADIGCFLLTFSMAMTQLDAGVRSLEAFKYGVFLKALWQHFQWTIDKLFLEIRECCSSLPGTTTEKLNTSLKKAGSLLLFDTPDIRQATRQLIVSALAVSEGRDAVDGIGQLLDLLTQRDDLDDLMPYLEPFET